MSSKIKNILIFLGIGLALVLVYFLLFSNKSTAPALTTSTGNTTSSANSNNTNTSTIGKDFLNVLLSVKSIKIDDAIFKDPAFLSLQDSSIELVPDGTEGRSNPFAPIGFDNTIQNIVPINNQGIVPTTNNTLTPNQNTVQPNTPTLPVIAPITPPAPASTVKKN